MQESSGKKRFSKRALCTRDLRPMDNHVLIVLSGFPVSLEIARCLSPEIADNRIHIGVSYVTTRLGSAMGSNAIKQGSFLLSPGFYFRHTKQLQPFTRLNFGYFHADYEYAVFDVLPNKAFLYSIDAGLSYEFGLPFTVSLSAGYNFNSGTGSSGPGTLFPVFYQMSACYTVLKKK